MNARQRRDARRRPTRRAYARSQRMTTVQAMRPAVAKQHGVSYQGSGAQGYGSDWARSATTRDAVTIDRRWDSTAYANRDA